MFRYENTKKMEQIQKMEKIEQDSQKAATTNVFRRYRKRVFTNTKFGSGEFCKQS